MSLLRCFCSTCFYSSAGFNKSNFAAFQVWLLKCYFFFSNKTDIFFFLNFGFHFLIYPGRLLIIKYFALMGNKIFHDIKNSFIKNWKLLIYIVIRKNSFPAELGYQPLNWIITCILIVPDNPSICRWIENFQVKFRMYYLMITIRVKVRMNAWVHN